MKLLLSIYLACSIASATTLGIGTISGKPQHKMLKFKPIADYLEKHLQSHGVDHVYPRFAKDIPSMLMRVKKGEVNLFIDSIYATTFMFDKAAATPVLRRWKKGTASYQSILISQKESGILTLDDLKGKTIGFEDRFSSSGYMVPKLGLILKGYQFQFQGATHPDKLRYIFSHGEDDKSAVFQLIKKRYDVAATNDVFFDKYKHKEQFNVIYRSPMIPRHIVSFARIPETLRQPIIQTLLQMDSVKEGQEALEKFDNTTRFDLLEEKDITLIEEYQKHLDKI